MLLISLLSSIIIQLILLTVPAFKRLQLLDLDIRNAGKYVFGRYVFNCN
jgi:hypothetical protein